jgi:hypothetical protein
MSSRLDIRGSDSVGVGIPAYAGEDVKAALGEFAGGGGADSRRGPGHHHERMTEGDVCLSQKLSGIRLIHFPTRASVGELRVNRYTTRHCKSIFSWFRLLGSS